VAIGFAAGAGDAVAGDSVIGDAVAVRLAAEPTPAVGTATVAVDLWQAVSTRQVPDNSESPTHQHRRI